MEDSKFLMESSMAQNSISMPHQSKFTENDEHDHNSRGMQNIPENNSLYHESQDMLADTNPYMANS